MLSDEDRKIAEELKQKLIDSGIQPVQFVVFGSRARGDNTDASDLDVMVVVHELTRDVADRIRNCAWEIGFEQEVPIFTVKFSTDELTSGPTSELPLLKAIEAEGIAL